MAAAVPDAHCAIGASSAVLHRRWRWRAPRPPHQCHGVYRGSVGAQQSGVALGRDVQEAQRAALGAHHHLATVWRQANS